MTHVGVGAGWLGTIDGMPPRCGMLVMAGDDPVAGGEQIGGEGGMEATPRPVTRELVSVVPEPAAVDPDWTWVAPPVVDVVAGAVDVGAGMIPLV